MSDRGPVLQFRIGRRRSQEISWDKLFEEFERADLAFVFRETGPDGELDDLHELVRRAGALELIISGKSTITEQGPNRRPLRTKERHNIGPFFTVLIRGFSRSLFNVSVEPIREALCQSLEYAAGRSPRQASEQIAAGMDSADVGDAYR
jgi:hypothetical protein